MTLITALELAGNYPDNISIISRKDQTNGKYSFFCYLMRNGEIHKLMLSSSPVFNSVEEAKNTMHKMAKEIKCKYS